jgi:hypothetical protein
MLHGEREQVDISDLPRAMNAGPIGASSSRSSSTSSLVTVPPRFGNGRKP